MSDVLWINKTHRRKLLKTGFFYNLIRPNDWQHREE